MLHEDLALDKVFLRRFKREAETLAKLQHPNIVRFYGFEVEPRQAYMLMGYVSGESLKHKIYDSDEPMDLEEILDIMRSLCSALGYAHKQGLVHCDIKPGNVIFAADDTPFLTDFGIARLTDPATATMVGAGTPAYMAPEQVRGLHPVPQTDIYALGVMLFELVTGGERPFTGENAPDQGSTSAQVRWEQINLQPPSPRVINQVLSIEMEDIILKCLAKDPDDRYQNASELINALEAVIVAKSVQEKFSKKDPVGQTVSIDFQDNSNVTRKVFPGSKKSHNGIGQRKWLSWVGMVVVLAVIVAIIGSGITPPIGRPDEGLTINNIGVTESQLVEASMETGTVKPTITNIPTNTYNPTSTLPPIIKPTLPARAPEIMLEDLPAGALIGLKNTSDLYLDKIDFFSVNPQGDKLAMYGHQGLWIYDSETLNVYKILTQEEIQSVSWSPEGTHIASIGNDWIGYWNIETESQQLFHYVGEFDKEHLDFDNDVVDWSPTGALITHTYKREIYQMDLTSNIYMGSMSFPLPLDFNIHYDEIHEIDWSPDGRFLSLGFIYIWDGLNEWFLDMKNDSFRCADQDWSPDSQLIACAQQGYLVSVWTARNNRLYNNIWLLENPTSIAWSPVDELIAIGLDSGRIVLHHPTSGRELFTIEGHTSDIKCLDWTPDGRRLYSLSSDGIFYVWDFNDLVKNGENE